MKAKIYVVDDDPLVAGMIATLLETEGHEVDFFIDPCAALDAFVAADPKPALLVADYSMPKMDGIELLRRFKVLSPRLRIIMVSGMLREADLEKLRHAKPDMLLQKPFENSVLLEIVQIMLEAPPPSEAP